MLRSMFERVSDGWLQRPYLDTILPLALMILHVALWHFAGAFLLLEHVKVQSRPSLYSASALVISLTGTFTSLAVGQYLSNKGDRIKALKREFADVLGSTWRSIFLGTLASSALLLAAFGLDSRAHPNALGIWLFEAAILLALPRLVRLAVLTSKIIDVSVIDEAFPLKDESDEDINKDLFSD